ncbi:hypothetical protein [Streptomyces sp. NPDC056323]|uniref:hypothetical protein n=1 Tax=Streptomyces sp. NPDC056323 TaxID=3345784 RepID=UPI0035DCE2A3
MTTSPPQVNGHKRPAMPVLGDWLPVDDQPTPEPTTTTQSEPTAPAVDLVAQAEADAIRTRALADAEEQRIRAEAAADALKIKAAEEARKLKLANDKAAARAAEEQAARDARIAESNRKREEADRAKAKARQDEQEQKKAEAATAEEIAKAADRWRRYAVMFYAVCAVVALPVQIAAFWDPSAWWLVIAPLMLEGAALVVTKGAAAAVAAQRPHWHYRTVAWVFAFIAAGINLWHGMAAFDPATAIGTAFASIAGPGVWDLHEHGRIRKRDGVLSRRERKALERTAKTEAAEKVAAEKREAERQAYREKAAREAAEKLAADRKGLFPKVWDHALKLAADLGEHTVTDAIWKRAKRNVEGADPGEDAETLRMRNAAERRVAAARENASVSALGKTTNAQRAIQVKAPAKRSSYRPVPPRRKRGDTVPFHPVARALAADAKRQSNASTEEQK